MTEQDGRVQHMIEALREAGHRITPQRTAIAEVLARSVAHPSVEGIYEELQPRFPSMSLATVYKTVALFADLGLVLDLEHITTSGAMMVVARARICTSCVSDVAPSMTARRPKSPCGCCAARQRMLGLRLGPCVVR